METGIVVVAIVIALLIALGVYLHYHPALLAEVQSANAAAEANSKTLASIETTLAAHGIRLQALADKSGTVITDVEKSKLVTDLDAAVAAAKAAYENAVAIRNTVPAAPAPVA